VAGNVFGDNDVDVIHAAGNGMARRDEVWPARRSLPEFKTTGRSLEEHFRARRGKRDTRVEIGIWPDVALSFETPEGYVGQTSPRRSTDTPELAKSGLPNVRTDKPDVAPSP
jgi:hypothetical protein